MARQKTGAPVGAPGWSGRSLLLRIILTISACALPVVSYLAGYAQSIYALITYVIGTILIALFGAFDDAVRGTECQPQEPKEVIHTYKKTSKGSVSKVIYLDSTPSVCSSTLDFLSIFSLALLIKYAALYTWGVKDDPLIQYAFTGFLRALELYLIIMGFYKIARVLNALIEEGATISRGLVYTITAGVILVLLSL